MADIQFDITLDLVEKYVPAENVTVVQEDYQSVKFVYTILNREQPVDLSGATDIVVSFVKPDGHIVLQNDGTLVNGKVELVANPQTFTYVGKTYFQVQYKIDSSIYNTRQAFLWVERGNTSCQTLSSTDFAPMLDQAIQAGQMLSGIDLQALIDSKVTAENAQADVDALELRVGALEVTIVGLDSRVDTLEASQAAQDTKIITMETGLASVGSNLSGLTARVTTNESSISGLQTSQATQDTKIASLETGQADLSSRVTSVEGNITTVVSEVDALQLTAVDHETRIDGLEASMPNLDPINTAISALQTKDVEQDGRIGANEIAISAVQTKNTQQDTAIAGNATEIANLQAEQTTQNNRLTAAENKNAAQDSAIGDIQAKNTQQDAAISALQSSQATQDTDIAAIKLKNTQQDTAISANASSIVTVDTKVGANKAAQDTVNSGVAGSLSNHTTRIDALEADAIVDDARITNLEGDNTSNKSRISTVEGAIGVLNSDINDLQGNDAVQDSRLNAIETKNTNQDTAISGNTAAIATNKADADSKITGLTTRLGTAETDIAGLKTKDTQQDTRMSAIENKNDAQDTRMTTIEGVNTTQNTRLTNIETKNAEQDNRLTAVEGVNTTQDTRLTNVEGVNNTQNKKISFLENQSNGSIDSKSINKGMVTFNYDDGYPVHYSRVYKLIHEPKKVPMVAALDIWRVLRNTTGKVTYSQVMEMYNSGLVEVASHSMTHPAMDDAQDISLERMEWEVVESLKLLQKMGIEVNTFVTPVSTYSTDPAKVKLLKDNYSSAYTIFKNAITGSAASINMSSDVDVYGMWRARLDCGLVKAKQLVDYAETNNTWITFYGHNIGVGGDMTEEDLTALVDYALSKNVDIVTTNEAVSRISSVNTRKHRPELLPKNVRTLEGKGNDNLLKNAKLDAKPGEVIPNGWSFTNTSYTGTYSTSITRGSLENEFNVTFDGNNTGSDESGIFYQNYSVSNITEPLIINLSSKAKLTGSNMRYKIKIAPKYANGTQKYATEKEFEITGEYKKFDVSAVIAVDPLITTIGIALYPLNKAANNAGTISIKQPKLEIGFASSEWMEGSVKADKDYARVGINNSAAIPVPETTFVPMKFDVASENINSCYSTSTGLFTASYTGLYSIDTGLAYEGFSNIGARLLIALSVNGTRIQHSTSDSGGPDTGINLSSTLRLNAGDTVLLECWWRRQTGDTSTADPKKIKINPYTWATFAQIN